MTLINMINLILIERRLNGLNGFTRILKIKESTNYANFTKIIGYNKQYSQLITDNSPLSAQVSPWILLNVNKEGVRWLMGKGRFERKAESGEL